MFRELSRKNQQLSQEDCLEVLTQQPRGFLSVQGEDGYPYVMPMNFWYCEENGKLYFHTGKTGHRTDALAKCSKVSFCVIDEGYRNPGEWALNFRSVIIFGQLRLVEDRGLALDYTKRLSLKYFPDEAYIDGEINKFGVGVDCWELTPEHITGKKVKEE